MKWTSSYNQAVIDRLQKLSSERFDALVRPWLDQQLDHASPEEIGHDFFFVAPQFDVYRRDWSEKLGRWVAKRGTLTWSVQQIRDVVATGSHNLNVSIWAGARLSITEWLSPYGFCLSLANVCMPCLLQIQDRSPKHNLLAQMGATYAVNCSHVLSLLLLVLTKRNEAKVLLQVVNRTQMLTLAQEWDQAMAQIQVKAQNLDQALAQSAILARQLAKIMAHQVQERYQAWDAIQVPVQEQTLCVALFLAQSLLLIQWTLAEFQERAQKVTGLQKLTQFQERVQVLAQKLDQSLTQIHDVGQNLAPTLSEILPYVIDSPPPEWLAGTKGLSTEVVWSEWLFFSPDSTLDVLQAHIGILEKLAAASDDWSRLLGLTSLMLLGEGTPQRCAERNSLLDRGVQQPESFAFPSDVQEVTTTEEFARELPTLLQIIFLHKPGEPWLQPEWFDPSHPAAQFFRAGPREFFARAAEILDPEGKTELAKWRQREHER